MLLPPGYEFYSNFLFSFGPLGMQEPDLTLSVRNERPHKPYIIGQLFDEAQSLRRTTDRSRTTQQLRLGLAKILREVAPEIAATAECRLAYLGLQAGFVEAVLQEIEHYRQ